MKILNCLKGISNLNISAFKPKRLAWDRPEIENRESEQKKTENVEHLGRLLTDLEKEKDQLSAKRKDIIMTIGHAAALDILPPETYRKLATIPEKEIQSGLARNENTPPDVLAKLADSDDINVKYEVAENLKTPSEVLGKLANIPNRMLKFYVYRAQNTSADTLAQIEKDAFKDEVLGALLLHDILRKTRHQILISVASKENDPDVRLCVAGNSNAPISILNKLSKDKDPKVQKAALETIKNKH